MRLAPLTKLLDAARRLPVPVGAGAVGVAAPSKPQLMLPPRSDDPDLRRVDPRAGRAERRRDVARLLGELARRLEPELQRALENASRAWDQADAITVLDKPLRNELAAARAAWEPIALSDDPIMAAEGVEALLVLDTSRRLIELLERRLASIIRLRLGSGDPELLRDGRPFLDVAAALAELSKGWTDGGARK